MDIIEVLKDDHKKAKAMLEELEKTTSAAAKTRFNVLAKLEADLRRHMKFEEEVFYPAIKAGADKEGRALACEAYAEHEAASGILERLKEEPTSAEMWKAWLSVFKEGVEHHIREEEKELFKHAKAAIPAERRTEMAAEYQKMKPNGDTTAIGSVPRV